MPWVRWAAESWRADGRPEQVGLRLADAAGVGERRPAAASDPAGVRGEPRLPGRRAIDFISMGGFDERYRARMQDIDLCLRMRQAGLAIIFTPLTEVQRLVR